MVKTAVGTKSSIPMPATGWGVMVPETIFAYGNNKRVRLMAMVRTASDEKNQMNFFEILNFLSGKILIKNKNTMEFGTAKNITNLITHKDVSKFTTV